MKIKQRHGFTLLEVLLSIGIGSMVALCVYNIFEAGINLSRHARDYNRSLREAMAGLTLITEDLENMVPYDFSHSYPDRKAFMGRRESLSFLKADKDGLKIIEYYLESLSEGEVRETLIGTTSTQNRNITTKYEEVSDRLSLIRRETGFIDYLSSPKDSHKGEEIITTGFKKEGLIFSFGSRDRKQGPGVVWKDSWDAPRAPRFIRIELDLPAEGKDAKTIRLHKDVLVPQGATEET